MSVSIGVPSLSIFNRYISSGDGSGNAYGVAAVAAVVFPILSFARIYAPGPPMTYVMKFFTLE